ncbi:MULTISPECIES: hydroxymethylglutaryl-CoA lyase [Enterobacteriaceae]|uniref:hydroxymethylglutaryl-CoA lyase n=1 Tax=Enterobacteriaceae TaxID=543 RepID=UPI00226B86B5|nr:MULTISPECIES: hydroxymethylglutaryl-CoA lyase [Enterobacteriaceae]MCX9044462.1 hydroxymethylglutaryl-CoA lyase [Citrobacter portucalensis]MDA8491006.1 hydroxymethylglutaryl-CoA lyase [Kluyvera sp. Awk 3]
MTKLAKNIYIQEVAPRDGLQNEAQFVHTEDKVVFIDALSLCGYAKIEATSFTSPRAIPALKDAEDVMKRIKRQPGVEYTVLVPNLRGAERALHCGIDEANLVMSASESHNLTNLRMRRQDSVHQLSEVIQVFTGSAVAINVSLSTAFGCPMEGPVEKTTLLRLIETFAQKEVRGITLCDTTGMAYPSQVEEVCRLVRSYFPQLQFTLHFHDTRGMALANTLAALSTGIDRFDASLGGLGGCPYAPGASGNVSTEDMVHMLQLMGYQTGVDLDAVISVAKTLPALIGHNIRSSVTRAGKTDDLHPIPLSFEQGLVNKCQKIQEAP